MLDLLLTCNYSLRDLMSRCLVYPPPLVNKQGATDILLWVFMFPQALGGYFVVSVVVSEQPRQHFAPFNSHLDEPTRDGNHGSLRGQNCGGLITNESHSLY